MRRRHSPNASETDEDDLDEQLRAINATKSKRHPPKPNKHHSSPPLIPKEQFDKLTEQVKEIIKKQHVYYHNLIRKIQLEAQRKPSPSRRSQHYSISYDEPFEQ